MSRPCRARWWRSARSVVSVPRWWSSPSGRATPAVSLLSRAHPTRCRRAVSRLVAGGGGRALAAGGALGGEEERRPAPVHEPPAFDQRRERPHHVVGLVLQQAGGDQRPW